MIYGFIAVFTIDTIAFYILILATVYSVVWAENIILFYTWSMLLFSLLSASLVVDEMDLGGARDKSEWKIRKLPWFKPYHHTTNVTWVLILAAGGWFWMAGITLLYKLLLLGTINKMEKRIWGVSCD